MNKKRMVYAEQKAFLELHAVIGQMGFVIQGLERRIGSIKGVKGYINSAIALLTKAANEMTRTLPDEQRAHLLRQMVGLYMHVGVRDKFAEAKRNTKSGRLMTYEELDVVAEAIRECCRFCNTNDHQQQKQCKFCKLMDSLPVDKPDEDAVGCGYFAMW